MDLDCSQGCVLLRLEMSVTESVLLVRTIIHLCIRKSNNSDEELNDNVRFLFQGILFSLKTHYFKYLWFLNGDM